MVCCIRGGACPGSSTAPMYEFAEIGLAVRTRRSDMGLTQARVADLCGLLPTTVEQLENGSIEKLDWAVAIRITAQLGLNIHISNPRPTRRQMDRMKSALDAAAITASVSYRNSIKAEDLRAAFLTATNPPDYAPHVRTFLVWCADLFCTYRPTRANAAFARVTLARMSEALAVQMKGLGFLL